jgi:hypothetical protein
LQPTFGFVWKGLRIFDLDGHNLDAIQFNPDPYPILRLIRKNEGVKSSFLTDILQRAIQVNAILTRWGKQIFNFGLHFGIGETGVSQACRLIA